MRSQLLILRAMLQQDDFETIELTFAGFMPANSPLKDLMPYIVERSKKLPKACKDCCLSWWDFTGRWKHLRRGNGRGCRYGA